MGAGVKPYYEQDGIVIFHGDAREVLPSLEPADVVITDPVWPNAVSELAGSDDPAGLFAEVAALIPQMSRRLVVQLGCDSDPRFLYGVPPELKFIRACWLEYVRPHYKGRILYTNDVAYVFGDEPPSRPGAHVLPGRVIQNDAAKRPKGHPCPRQAQHVRWLVSWFARGHVVDPFMGSGTTLVEAKAMGLTATGIDVEEKFCEIAAKRLMQSVMVLA